MSEKKKIEVFGKATKQICAGCEGHSCGSCSPAAKQSTISLVEQFEKLLEASEYGKSYSVCFYESTPENLKKNQDVEKLLSMAELDPVICIDGKVKYLGGFSPEGLLEELKKFSA